MLPSQVSLILIRKFAGLGDEWATPYLPPLMVS
jgi:hypothetical protein